MATFKGVDLRAKYKQYDIHNNDPKYKVSPAFLFAGGVLILGAAAVIVGLYLPEHMPTVIGNAVQHLNKTHFYLTLVAAILAGVGGLGLLKREYNKLDVNSVSRDFSENEPVYHNTRRLNSVDSDDEDAYGFGEQRISTRHNGLTLFAMQSHRSKSTSPVYLQEEDAESLEENGYSS